MLRSNSFHARFCGSTSEGQPRLVALLAAMVIVAATASAHAHDTWVQTSSKRQGITTCNAAR